MPEFPSAAAFRKSHPNGTEGGYYLPFSSSPHMETGIITLSVTALEVGFFPTCDNLGGF